eukprot:5869593-Heterocapsa_arctica.AAC.1
MAVAIARLCWLQHRSGGHFSIENPRTSHVWRYPAIEALLVVACDVDFDQCMYGLTPPHISDTKHGPRITKATRIRTTLEQLNSLS